MPDTSCIHAPYFYDTFGPRHDDGLLVRSSKPGRPGQTAHYSYQQLYRVALNVMWTNPEQFVNVVLRLGDMHMLMSFVGSVGSLMTETGLADIMSGYVAGVPKMPEINGITLTNL